MVSFRFCHRTVLMQRREQAEALAEKKAEAEQAKAKPAIVAAAAGSSKAPVAGAPPAATTSAAAGKPRTGAENEDESVPGGDADL